MPTLRKIIEQKLTYLRRDLYEEHQVDHAYETVVSEIVREFRQMLEGGCCAERVHIRTKKWHEFLRKNKVKS